MFAHFRSVRANRENLFHLSWPAHERQVCIKILGQIWIFGYTDTRYRHSRKKKGHFSKKEKWPFFFGYYEMLENWA
jgi:hypothetical protein